MNPKISIVIPTLNEAGNIATLIPRIFEVLSKNKVSGGIVIVDDNSPDGTAEVARKLSKKYPIRLIVRPKKLGLGSAYVLGFKEALKSDADIIFQMDGDWSHDPKYLPDFIGKILEGYDMVVGTRYTKGGGHVAWPLHRRLISGGANLLIKLVADLPVVDVTTGYRAYRRQVIERIDLDSIRSKGYEFQLELLSRANSFKFKIGETPIIFCQRKVGKSKLSKEDIKNFFIRALEIRKIKFSGGK